MVDTQLLLHIAERSPPRIRVVTTYAIMKPVISSRFRRSSNVFPSWSSLYNSTSDSSDVNALADSREREYTTFNVRRGVARIAGYCATIVSYSSSFWKPRIEYVRDVAPLQRCHYQSMRCSRPLRQFKSLEFA
jgi:hypothetical protein